MTLAALGERWGLAGIDFKKQLRDWGWCAAALFLALYLGWAASAPDPRSGTLWQFSQPGGLEGEGWLVPAPSLGHVLIAAALLFAALSMKACSLLAKGAGTDANALASNRQSLTEDISSRQGKFVLAAILIGGMFVRLHAWAAATPLDLNPEALAAPDYIPSAIWRWPALFAELLTLTVLLLAQKQTGRTFWIAALYAFHPLAILATATGAWQVWLALLITTLGALGWRMKRWPARILLFAAAALSILLVARQALHPLSQSGAQPFNGLIANWLSYMELDQPPRAMLLTAITFLLQTLILFLALWKKWTFPKALGNILLVFALTTPNLTPYDILPLLALITITWNAAAWILTGTALLIFTIAWSWQPQDPYTLPTWLIYVIFTPPLVAAAADWCKSFLSDPVKAE